jgi:hypothetical protein
VVAALRARAERGDTGWACGRGDLASIVETRKRPGQQSPVYQELHPFEITPRRAPADLPVRQVGTASVRGRPAQHSPDAHLVGHLNRISIIAGLIVCCWRLWLPGADPGEAEAAVTLGRAGLLWRSRVAALTDLGEACLTR